MSVETAGIELHAGLFPGLGASAPGMRRLRRVVFVTVIAPFGKLAGTLTCASHVRAQAAAPPAPCLPWVERLTPWRCGGCLRVFVAYVKLAIS